MKNNPKDKKQISELRIDDIDSVIVNIQEICSLGDINLLIKISKDFGGDLNYGEAINYYITSALGKYSFSQLLKYLKEIVSDETYGLQLSDEDKHRIVVNSIKGKKLPLEQLYTLLTFNVFAENAMLISDILPASKEPEFRNLLFFIAEEKVSKLIEFAYQSKIDRKDVVIDSLIRIVSKPEFKYNILDFDDFPKYYSEVSNANKQKVLQLASLLSVHLLFEYIMYLLNNNILGNNNNIIESAIKELEQKGESATILLKILNNKITDSLTRHPELTEICRDLNTTYGYPIGSYVKQQIDPEIEVQPGISYASVDTIASELDTGFAEKLLHNYQRILENIDNTYLTIRENLVEAYFNTFTIYGLHLELEVYGGFLKSLKDPRTLLNNELLSMAHDLDIDYREKKIATINGQYSGSSGAYCL